jgi:hypothetical protein
MYCCPHFDGRKPLAEIPFRLQRKTGRHLSAELIERLVEQLDRAKLLDGPTFSLPQEDLQRGVNLCHVGPEFGEPHPIDGKLQETVRQFDGEVLDHAAAADPAQWFQTSANISKPCGLCGLAATSTMFHAIAPATGRLRYHQAVDDGRTSCASFASMEFHTPEDPLGSKRSCTNDHTIY